MLTVVMLAVVMLTVVMLKVARMEVTLVLVRAPALKVTTGQVRPMDLLMERILLKLEFRD